MPVSNIILSDYQLSHPSLSHIEQECQKSLIHEKIYTQQNSNKVY